MATSLRELIVSVTADTSRYQREMDRASRMGAQYFRTVREGGADANRSWSTQTAAARTHATAIEAGTQAITRYAGAMAAAIGAGQLVQLADGWTGVNNRLRLVTQSTEDFAQAQADVLRIARSTYQDLDSTASVYQNLAMVQDRLGLSSQETARLVETVNKTIAMSGSSAAAASGALVQLGQAFASGTLRAEEFNSLMAGASKLVMTLEDGLGVARGSLRQMVVDGKVSAQDMAAALLKMSGDVDESFSRMDATISQSMVNLRTAFQEFVGQSSDVSGASSAISSGINAIAENMNAIATVGGAAALGAIAGKMVQMGSAAAQSAVSFVQSRAAALAEATALRDATLAAQLKAQADLRRAQAAMGAVRGTAESARASRNLAAALLAERQATLAAAQAQAAYAGASRVAASAGRAALGLLGGPAGLAIMVGTAAAGWLMFRDNNDKATESLIDFGGAADQAIEKFRELNRAQQAGQILKLEEQISESADSIRDSLNNMFGTANREIGSNFSMPYREAILGLQQQFDAGKISADEFSAKLSGLTADLLEGKPAGDRLRETYIRYGESVATAAREVERKRGVLQSFNAVNAEAGKQANVTAGAVDNQAKALQEAGKAAEQAGNKIRSALSSIPGQIARIGKNARQVAELDVADWFQAEAAAGTNFSMRDDPKVKEMMQQGERYIRLVVDQDQKQKALTASTKALSAARKEAAKASADDEYLGRLNESYAEQVMNLEREIALYGEVGRSAALAYDLANGSLSLLTEAQQQSLINLTATLDAIDDYAAIYDDLSGGLRGMESSAAKTADQMTTYADQAARNIQSYLGDSMYNILDGKFSDIGDSFSQMIKRMLSELAASQLLNMLGGAMAGYAGEGGFGNFIRGVGGAITKGAGKAGGGVAQPRTMMPVAEHGPELLQVGGQTMLMMGAQQGLVSPLMNKAGGGGGRGDSVDVTVNVHGAPGGASATARRNDSGGLDIDVLLEQVDRHIGSNIANGTGATYQAQKSRFRLSDAI